MAVKLIAVDMDGTFLRTGNHYDRERFERLHTEMKNQGIEFVIASGNQYYQLKSFFPTLENELSFVAENGAYVLPKNKPLFVGEMDMQDVARITQALREMSEIDFLICGEKSAYAFTDVNQKFYERIQNYYHRHAQITSLDEVDDKLFKFAIHCPIDKTEEYVAKFSTLFPTEISTTSSGHGDIDLIIPGLHKASGLARLGEVFGIAPSEMMTFGDGGNDVEMLKYAGYGVVMENAHPNLARLTPYKAPHHNDDGVLEVIEAYLTDGLEGLEKFK